MKDRSFYTLYLASLYLLLVCAITPLLASLGFLLNIGLSPLHFPAALLVSALLLALPEGGEGGAGAPRSGTSPAAQRALAVLLGLAVIALGVWLQRDVYDFSYDGRHYHQAAVIELNDGWNPVLGRLEDEYTNMLVEAFAGKGVWYLSASIAKLFGLNAGRAYHIMAAAAAFFMCLYTFCQPRRDGSDAGWWRRALCLYMVMNPVLIYQLFSNYADAYMYNLWLLFFCAMVRVDSGEARLHGRCTLAVVLCVIGIIGNIKFTGLFFAGAFYFVFWARWSLPLLRAGDYRAILRLAAPGLAGLGLVLVIGINPYITNVLHGRHIFHPMLGENAMDLMAENVPVQLRGKPGFVKFISCLFMGSGGELKLPFTFTRGDLSLYYDQRLGGFGPLYSGMLVLALIMMLLAAIARRRGSPGSEGGLYLYICVCIIIIGLVFPESWWPRYYPLMWALPGFALLAAADGDRGGAWVPLTLALSFANIALCFHSTYPAILWDSRDMDAALRRLGGRQVTVYSENYWLFFRSYEHMLRRGGVDFTVSDIPLEGGVVYNVSDLQIKVE